MPIYIVLCNLSLDDKRIIKETPNKVKEAEKEYEALGVKVIAQYATLGRYDLVSIVEAPDNDTIMKTSLELGSRGTVHLMSMPAKPLNEFVAMFKK